jgi:hypothetical protein
MRSARELESGAWMRASLDIAGCLRQIEGHESVAAGLVPAIGVL